MPLEADGLLLLDDEGLLLEPMLLEVVPDDPMVLEPLEPESVADPMVLLPGLDDALEPLPRLRQGVVLPELEAPMPLVLELLLEPVPELASGLVLELAPGPVLELLEDDCACTANEATATAALAARTASLWVLVMSEVLWLSRSNKVPARRGCLANEAPSVRSNERDPWRFPMGRIHA